MKKILAMSLAVIIMMLSLAACGDETTPSDSDTPLSDSQSEENIRNDVVEESTDNTANETEVSSVLDQKTQLVYFETERIRYAADGSVSGYQTYEYDEVGYLLREVYKDHTSNATTTYEYDTDGKMLLKEIANAGGAVYRNEYEYNGEFVSKEFLYENNTPLGRIEYEYDPDGNITLQTSYNVTGGVFTTIREYDDSGYLVKEAYGERGEAPSKTTTYTYDVEGNKTSENVETTTNGFNQSYYEWEYDANGDITEEIHREYERNELEREYITSYVYERNIDGMIEKKESKTQGFYNYNKKDNRYSCYIYEYNSNKLLYKESRMNNEGELTGWVEYEYDATNNLIKETNYSDLGFVTGWIEYSYQGINIPAE